LELQWTKSDICISTIAGHLQLLTRFTVALLLKF